MNLWWGVLAGAAGCYAIKVLGLSLPRRWLEDPRVHHVGELLPVALLSALIAGSALGQGEALVFDAPRVAAVAAAVIAVRVKAPFLAVVVLAAATAAVLRTFG